MKPTWPTKKLGEVAEFINGYPFGGIATNTNQKNYKGRWVYFDKPCSKLKEDFSDWKNLEL